MSSLASQQVLVLGLGNSGLAAAELALFQGATVTVLDTETNRTLEERADRLTHRGAKVQLDWTAPAWSGPVDLAVISPGVRPDSLLGQLAAGLKCPVLSELELGYRASACPIIAITGTNGKTTTTELVTHILKGLGKKVIACGNIGLPLCEAARKSAGLDYLVVEVSSFQLEQVRTFAPLAAALLNLTDDHLDRHGTRAAYLELKLRLFAHLQQPAQMVVNAALLHDPAVQALPCLRRGPPLTFSTDPADTTATYGMDAERNLYYRGGAQPELLLRPDELRLMGDHNRENVLAALALCHAVGLPLAELTPPVKRFAPSAHRLELVKVARGVKYINDSKATNPDAVIQALKACAAERRNGPGKVLLIAGGRDKEMSFVPLIPYLQAHVKQVFLIGEMRDELAALWSPHVPCRICPSLAAVVAGAIEAATPGDLVLLSPGCASMDMFKDYADRGNQFAHEVKSRLGE